MKKFKAYLIGLFSNKSKKYGLDSYFSTLIYDSFLGSNFKKFQTRGKKRKRRKGKKKKRGAKKKK